MSAEPRLSYVLVTDTYETIRGVVRALAAQTRAGELEVVLVGPAAQPLEVPAEEVAAFAGHRVVAVERILPLEKARAAGVRAATAPLVNVGETHAFHEPGFSAAVMDAFDGPWAAVVPGFDNGNPGSALSWANFTLDYSRWSFVLPPGEIDFLPAYNTTFRREFLLGLGEVLDAAFGVGHDIGADLRREGRMTWFEPNACIAHVNVCLLRHAIRERFLLARSQAAHRAESWSRARRAVYVCGSPLIPAVLAARVWGGLTALRRERDLSFWTYAAMINGLLVRMAGEITGFVAGATDRQHQAAEEYEVHKLRFITPGSRAAEPRPVDDAGRERHVRSG